MIHAIDLQMLIYYHVVKTTYSKGFVSLKHNLSPSTHLEQNGNYNVQYSLGRITWWITVGGDIKPFPAMQVEGERGSIFYIKGGDKLKRVNVPLCMNIGGALSSRPIENFIATLLSSGIPCGHSILRVLALSSYQYRNPHLPSMYRGSDNGGLRHLQVM